MSSNSSTTTPELLSAALDSFIPGFSLFARVVSIYLRIDVSSFSFYIILLAILSPFFGLILPRFLENLRKVLLFSTASIEIPYQDKLHKQFTQWMPTNDWLRDSRRSIAWAKDDIIFPWQSEDDEDDQNEDPVKDQEYFENDRKGFWLFLREKGNMKPIRCTPCRNKFHLFRYRGYFLALHRESRENHNSILFANAETIRVYSFFWQKNVLLGLLQEVQKASVDKKKKKITIYRGIKQQNTVRWISTTSKPPRPPSTLALAPHIKERFIEDIETFLSPKNKKWYQSHGIPYRRGYLLYGPPGTGKSSICFVIAGYLCLDIYTISLNSRKLDEDGLATLFQDLPKRCIVLLEDVDNAGIQNRRTQGQTNTDEPEDPFEDSQSGGITLSALLNCLDGVGAHEGRILIMTTNHEDKLDEALKRPGRVDQKYYFGCADTSSIKQLFQMFYAREIDEGSTCTPLDSSKELVDHSTRDDILSDRFAGIVPSEQFTAAEISNYLMDFRQNPDEAVAKAADWIMHKKKTVTSRA